jgi:hypothetical protein
MKIIPLEQVLELFTEDDVLRGEYIIEKLMLIKDQDINNFFNSYLGFSDGSKQILEYSGDFFDRAFADWSLNDYNLVKKYKRMKKIDDILK